MRIADTDLAPFSQTLGTAGLEESAPLPPVLASKLVRWWRMAQTLCPPELPAPSPQNIESMQKAIEIAPTRGGKRNMAGVVDQKDGTLYTPLSTEDIALMRLKFWKKTGGHPMESERSNDDQLTVLAGRLTAGRSPWVDFAVWTPYDTRRTKDTSLRPQVWVNNQLGTKTIAGPPTYEAWLSHFRIFRSAMIMCRGASPATLERYAMGVRQLLLRHPGAWDLVCIADELVRGEKWGRLM